jgi:hypothetical protein
VRCLAYKTIYQSLKLTRVIVRAMTSSVGTCCEGCGALWERGREGMGWSRWKGGRRWIEGRMRKRVGNGDGREGDSASGREGAG